MKHHTYSGLIIHRIRLTTSRLRQCFYTLLIPFTLALFSLNSQAYAVGFKWIEEYDLRIGVWYPSPEKEVSTHLGPFDAELAVDGVPEASGSYQVILFSHGNLGRVSNHHVTAKALAEAGFIVIAPLHSADHLMAGDDIANALDWRVTELRFALESVMQDNSFRSIMDISRIHALGYSLGALTALNAAGARIDVPSAEEQCATEFDPAFCDLPSWSSRWRINRLRETSTPSFNRSIEDVHHILGFVTGGVATVGPVGQGFGVDANTFRGQQLLVIGLTEDDVTIPKFHALNIANAFSDVLETEVLMFKAHHSAFISPFAKRITDIEHIPAAIDPPGFDRMNFLTEVNQALTDFFIDARSL